MFVDSDSEILMFHLIFALTEDMNHHALIVVYVQEKSFIHVDCRLSKICEQYLQLFPRESKVISHGSYALFATDNLDRQQPELSAVPVKDFYTSHNFLCLLIYVWLKFLTILNLDVFTKLWELTRLFFGAVGDNFTFSGE